MVWWEKVLAVEIDEYPEGANTGHLPCSCRLMIHLGSFWFRSEHAESHGFDGAADEGQEYLYFKLD